MSDSRDVLQEVRKLEDKIWKVWKKEAAPYLLLCQEFKIHLDGEYTPKRLFTRAQFMAWQGYWEEAEILLEKVLQDEFFHPNLKMLERLRETIAKKEKSNIAKPIKEVEQAFRVKKNLQSIRSIVFQSKHSYAQQVFYKLEAALAPLLQAKRETKDIACDRHPTEIMLEKTIVFPHYDNDFQRKVTLQCLHCGREKQVIQKDGRPLEISNRSEIYQWFTQLKRTTRRTLNQNQWLRDIIPNFIF